MEAQAAEPTSGLCRPDLFEKWDLVSMDRAKCTTCTRTTFARGRRRVGMHGTSVRGSSGCGAASGRTCGPALRSAEVVRETRPPGPWAQREMRGEGTSSFRDVSVRQKRSQKRASCRTRIQYQVKVTLTSVAGKSPKYREIRYIHTMQSLDAVLERARRALSNGASATA